jgi:hypothetical protein
VRSLGPASRPCSGLWIPHGIYPRGVFDHAHKQDIKPILRRGQLKRQYGLSPADYDALLAKQDGVCATCGKPSKETLCVDHCHATGTIRGLLCRQCNFALGCFTDSQAAAACSSGRAGRGCAAAGENCSMIVAAERRAEEVRCMGERGHARNSDDFWHLKRYGLHR